MRNTFNLATILLLGGCRFVLSQNGYNGVTIDLDGTLNCPPDANRRSYCAGDSNSTEFIVHCDNGNARLGACSLDLVGVQPVGVKLGATCFEESKTAGDAVCVYDGKEFDTRPFPSGATATPTRVGETRPTGTGVSTVPVDDIAVYIMDGIRHVSN
ncbi:hypothetical protein TWF106_002110 [Orbilia oligospora]|uniref:Cyanovirin-N domain-containing protein n=1 Tax=Orbilia oligospora TaxID=2813651 RepID=A0A6G1M2X7_ORBOL|nr:hypothetical protein TWF788_010438 [Orbilia oligospora]KAF3202714.1 hypothetical protein TWF679_010676 [Orbilia oligospora]KAF3225592.1 hypothetical protein TWF106_002110 [Orbilia oligospora]KAF3226190.1 hypothetical protein TWF191_004852 [Orbilia oligospora]KAF3241796.1 hypothetical protein TWF192_008810 [Orbilia oligospora]